MLNIILIMKSNSDIETSDLPFYSDFGFRTRPQNRIIDFLIPWTIQSILESKYPSEVIHVYFYIICWSFCLMCVRLKNWFVSCLRDYFWWNSVCVSCVSPYQWWNFQFKKRPIKSKECESISTFISSVHQHSFIFENVSIESENAFALNRLSMKLYLSNGKDNKIEWTNKRAFYRIRL